LRATFAAFLPEEPSDVALPILPPVDPLLHCGYNGGGGAADSPQPERKPSSCSGSTRGQR
jgi:hypothetical protein